MLNISFKKVLDKYVKGRNNGGRIKYLQNNMNLGDNVACFDLS